MLKLILNKNKQGVIPLYASADIAADVYCGGPVLSPTASLPPLQYPGSTVSLFTITNVHTGVKTTLPTSLFTTVSGDLGDMVQYDGGPIGPFLDSGLYMLEIEIDGTRWYSHYISMCDDGSSPCLPETSTLAVTACQEEDDCCADVLAIHSGSDVMQLGGRDDTTDWTVEFLGTAFANALISAGATSVNFAFNVSDEFDNPITVTPVGSYDWTVTVASSVATVSSLVTITFDWDCNGVTESGTLTASLDIDKTEAGSGVFVYKDYGTPNCSGFTAPDTVDFTFTATDNVSSSVVLKSIYADAPLDQEISGDSATFSIPLNSSPINIERRITTACNTVVKVYELTFNSGDPCNGYTLVDNTN